MCLSNTLISLGIHPVWSVFAVSFIGSQGFMKDSKDYEQTGQLPRHTWVFFGCTDHLLCFVELWLNFIITLFYQTYLVEILNDKVQNEPSHDKTNKMTAGPAKTQISLSIRLVWPESSLCTQWVAKEPSFLHVDSEDSDQIGWIPRLIWVLAKTLISLGIRPVWLVFAGRIRHFVGFVTRRLKRLTAMHRKCN